jgi:hypothetical protein
VENNEFECLFALLTKIISTWRTGINVRAKTIKTYTRKNRSKSSSL